MRNSLVATAGFRLLIAAASAITITVLMMADSSPRERMKNRRGTGRHSVTVFFFPRVNGCVIKPRRS